jgi:hypothetical protein
MVEKVEEINMIKKWFEEKGWEYDKPQLPCISDGRRDIRALKDFFS